MPFPVETAVVAALVAPGWVASDDAAEGAAVPARRWIFGPPATPRAAAVSDTPSTSAPDGSISVPKAERPSNSVSVAVFALIVAVSLWRARPGWAPVPWGNPSGARAAQRM